MTCYPVCRYRDVRVGAPNLVDQTGVSHATCPHECRLRDLTYAAPIYVDVEYVKGSQRHTRKDVEIGKAPQIDFIT